MVDVVISAGHGKYIRGAADIVDEVDEARKIVKTVASYMRKLGVEVITFADDVSTTQDENLHRIVDFHNDQGPHDLDVSIHLNAYEHTEKPMGCEVLFITEDELAEELSAAMSDAAGFIDRGGKYRDDLFFLNQTVEKAILIETFFCDSQADVDLYHRNYEELCMAIASILDEQVQRDESVLPPPEIVIELPDEVITPMFAAVGPCSHFGGPDDTGVDPDEGLAFIYEYEDAPHLFLPEQPPGTTGLARRLDPAVHYIACRWDYDVTPKQMLADPTQRAMVRAVKNGLMAMAWPADWGPHEDTGRIADLSPGLMELLDIETDDEVEVIYPAPALIS